MLLITSALRGFIHDVTQLARQDEVEQTVKTFSSDDMQGRGNIMPGLEKAAGFIEEEFKRAGLMPLPVCSDSRQGFYD